MQYNVKLNNQLVTKYLFIFTSLFYNLIYKTKKIENLKFWWVRDQVKTKNRIVFFSYLLSTVAVRRAHNPEVAGSKPAGGINFIEVAQ